ncbi:MAG: EVE domain-containing protein [Deltaproteobacteria bacterium]|nr:EVE domain-containing protein [Deltaproteobacteria bacterium]
MNYWLLKSDENEYSVSDLIKDGTTIWEGVRNYQARNFIKIMKKKDLVFFLQVKSKHPGIYALCEVVKEAYPDPTQFDQKSKYFDPRSLGARSSKQIWLTFDIKFIRRFFIDYRDLKRVLAGNKYFTLQFRLSVVPLSDTEAAELLRLSKKEDTFAGFN